MTANLIKITIYDDMEDYAIESSGQLNCATGIVSNIEYKDYDVAKKGSPATKEGYFDSYGVFSFEVNSEKKDIELVVLANKDGYSVSRGELQEIQEKIMVLTKNAEKTPVKNKGSEKIK